VRCKKASAHFLVASTQRGVGDVTSNQHKRMMYRLSSACMSSCVQELLTSMCLPDNQQPHKAWQDSSLPAGLCPALSTCTSTCVLCCAVPQMP
jgi:hypothetical protein